MNQWITIFLLAIMSMKVAAIDEVIKKASQFSGVNEKIFMGILLQESGKTVNGQFRPHPWALNIDRKAYFFDSKDEAVKKAIQAVREGKVIDVGMAQINVNWNHVYARNIEELFNPATNLFIGARVLRECSKRYDEELKVIGCYNQWNVDEDGIAYARKVIELAKKHVGWKGYEGILNSKETKRFNTIYGEFEKILSVKDKPSFGISSH